MDFVGNKLLEIRKAKDFTQPEMAHLLNIPTTTYQNYENNISRVDYKKLMEFAKKLNVDIQEFHQAKTSYTHNNQNSGQVGGTNFGTQHFYLGDDAVNSALTKENEDLRGKLNDLESKLQELIERFPKN